MLTNEVSHGNPDGKRISAFQLIICKKYLEGKRISWISCGFEPVILNREFDFTGEW
jgi:hypothetical protein